MGSHPIKFLIIIIAYLYRIAGPTQYVQRCGIMSVIIEQVW